jgi:hypothetical protein
MPEITITGAGDDVIEIDGDAQDEFYFYADDGRQGHLTFSDGTVMKVWYEGGTRLWRIQEGAIGAAAIVHVEAAQQYPGDPAYRRDFATVSGSISWIEVASDGGRGPRRVEIPTRQRD